MKKKEAISNKSYTIKDIIATVDNRIAIVFESVNSYGRYERVFIKRDKFAYYLGVHNVDHLDHSSLKGYDINCNVKIRIAGNEYDIDGRMVMYPQDVIYLVDIVSITRNEERERNDATHISFSIKDLKSIVESAEEHGVKFARILLTSDKVVVNECEHHYSPSVKRHHFTVKRDKYYEHQTEYKLAIK